jgi:hypothetical protein
MRLIPRCSHSSKCHPAEFRWCPGADVRIILRRPRLRTSAPRGRWQCVARMSAATSGFLRRSAYCLSSREPIGAASTATRGGKSRYTCTCQSSPSRKDISSAFQNEMILLFASRYALRGGRVVTNVEAGCGGRVGLPGERGRYGRQSRVVLAPRRWCQASRYDAREAMGQQGRFPKSAEDTVKPSRGMPVDRLNPVATAASLFAGAPWVRPSSGIPCALLLSRG